MYKYVHICLFAYIYIHTNKNVCTYIYICIKMPQEPVPCLLQWPTGSKQYPDLPLCPHG